MWRCDSGTKWRLAVAWREKLKYCFYCCECVVSLHWELMTINKRGVFLFCNYFSLPPVVELLQTGARMIVKSDRQLDCVCVWSTETTHSPSCVRLCRVSSESQGLVVALLFRFCSRLSSIGFHFHHQMKVSSFHESLHLTAKDFEKGNRKSHFNKKKIQITTYFLYKWMPCSLYLSLPEVSHYTPSNSPISHGSTHVVDAFRIYSRQPRSSGYKRSDWITDLGTDVSSSVSWAAGVQCQTVATSKSALMWDSKTELRVGLILYLSL